MSREDFVVSPANSQALAFIESWPNWTIATAALYGPPGCGKTHLASIWQAMTGARRISANEITVAVLGTPAALVIEDVDLAQATPDRDSALFAVMQTAAQRAPLLLTGIAPPPRWPWVLPDLASRFSALVALPIRAPDDTMLAGLARKLFADRQLLVAEEVIDQMLFVLERSPASVRAFVVEADATALSEGRPVNLSLVRRLLTARQGSS
jgi:chromosomal replication initiation ATPase DnaA